MSKKHIHKYQHLFMKYLNDKLWSCALPECSHHMPKHYEEMLLGRSSICWSCDEPFILDSENMKNDMPVCFTCSHKASPLASIIEKLTISE